MTTIDLIDISSKILEILKQNNVTNYSEIADLFVLSFSNLIMKDRKLLWDQKNELYLKMIENIKECARSIPKP